MLTTTCLVQMEAELRCSRLIMLYEVYVTHILQMSAPESGTDRWCCKSVSATWLQRMDVCVSGHRRATARSLRCLLARKLALHRTWEAADRPTQKQNTHHGQCMGCQHLCHLHLLPGSCSNCSCWLARCTQMSPPGCATWQQSSGMLAATDRCSVAIIQGGTRAQPQKTHKWPAESQLRARGGGARESHRGRDAPR